VLCIGSRMNVWSLMKRFVLRYTFDVVLKVPAYEIFLKFRALGVYPLLVFNCRFVPYWIPFFISVVSRISLTPLNVQSTPLFLEPTLGVVG